jgi:DNA-binding HxlR family transcriptional regulator
MEGCSVTVDTARGPVDPVETALAILGGKWKPLVIWYLKDETLRFTQLVGRIPKVTPRMLTKQLRELERDGLISREVFPEVPLRVEYSLTEQGRAAITVLEALYTWGTGYVNGENERISRSVRSPPREKGQKRGRV